MMDMTQKEKLEEAKRLYETANADQKYVLESLFPELKESEDERIRKVLRERIIRYDPNNEILIKEEGISQKQFLAWLEKQNNNGKVWIYRDVYVKEKEQAYQDGIDNVLNNPQKYGLEKQGEKKDIKEYNVCDFCEDRYGCVNPCPMKLIEEQKPTDKIEPKFRVGDWIIHKDNKHIPIKIIEKIGMYYRTVDTVNYYQNIYISYINENYRLWTIQDAKDGDVLCTSSTAINEVSIFKGLTVEGFIECYCSYDSEDEYCERKYHFIGKPTPATEEQRDLLFQKMKENGYEWDPEKKELKRIEQNHSEWSEEDEKYTNIVLAALYSPSAEGLYSFHKVKSSDVTNWFISLKDRVRLQSRWKPSDEQITWLYRAADDASKDSRMKQVLNNLLSDLKNLKGQ